MKKFNLVLLISFIIGLGLIIFSLTVGGLNIINGFKNILIDGTSIDILDSNSSVKINSVTFEASKINTIDINLKNSSVEISEVDNINSIEVTYPELNTTKYNVKKDNDILYINDYKQSSIGISWNIIDVKKVKISIPKGTAIKNYQFKLTRKIVMNNISTESMSINGNDIDLASKNCNSKNIEINSIDGNFNISNLNTNTLIMKLKDVQLNLNNITADTINANINDGDISVKNITSKELKFDLKDSVTNFENIQSNIDLVCTDKRIDFKNIKGDALTLKANVGNYALQNVDSKKVNISVKDGNVSYTNDGNVLDYDIKPYVKDGKISINDQKLQDIYANKNLNEPYTYSVIATINSGKFTANIK